MKVLCTSARMPFAVDEIRKFGEAGHVVYAADTFKTAPGLHASKVHERIITPQPKQETPAFIDDIAETLRSRDIDILVPMFEEVFYLAKHRDRFESLSELFFPAFDTLLKFHSKSNFVELCQQLGVPVPPTVVAHDDAELAAAVDQFPEYFARAAFSRGGVDLLTNTGPLAGAISVSDVHPTSANPWVVQGFVEGVDLCSFSVVHDGKVAAHVTYEHPKTIEHAGGIEFVSVVEPETLAHVRTFVEATGYTGQISFDYLRHPDGVVSMVECNPRPTDGVALMGHETFSQAVFAPSADTVVIDAGHKAQVSMALLRDAFRNPSELPSDLKEMFEAPDVYLGKHDIGPFLYQALSYSHVFAFRHHRNADEHHRKHTDLMAAQFYDIEWDGSPIA